MAEKITSSVPFEPPFWWRLEVATHGGGCTLLGFGGSCGQAYLDTGEARAIALALNNAADVAERQRNRKDGYRWVQEDDFSTVFQQGHPPDETARLDPAERKAPQ